MVTETSSQLWYKMQMEQGALGMVGTTFRRAGQAGLAYYTLPGPAAQQLHQACGFAESVYLATCNRVEVFFLAASTEAVAHYRQRIYDFFAAQHGPSTPAPFADARGLTAFAEEGAVERLMVVASALDSMVPGEAQILGQVKAALAGAQQQNLCGRVLSGLFEEAFTVAKKVRETTSLGRGRTSMVSLAIDLLAQRLTAEPSAAHASPLATLAVVGAGEMAEQCGQAFARRPGVRLLFVNRTCARAEALAQRFGGDFLPLASFQAKPPAFAAMLTSTASAQPLFGEAFLRQITAAPLLVDLSVNRDVDFAAAQRLHVALWDIDRLETRARAHHAARQEQVALGRTLVDEALDRYRRRQTERTLGQALARWRGDNQQALQAALLPLHRQLAKQKDLPPQVAVQVERWARGLLATWMHGPTHGLKQVAHLYGQQAVQAFVEAAQISESAALQPPSQEPLFLRKELL